MFVLSGVLLLVALATTNAEKEWTVLDAEVEDLKEKSCGIACETLMNAGLEGVSTIFQNLLKELHFNNGFCDCVVKGLGGFKHEQHCTNTADNTIFDHDIHVDFVAPNASCTCRLPRDPAAAAAHLNKMPLPVGKCGKDEIGNKLKNEPLTCEGTGERADELEEFEIVATYPDFKMDLDLRADTRGGEFVFPKSIKFITSDDKPIKIVPGSNFDEAWECLNNDKNIDSFSRLFYANSFKPIFDCLDEKDQYTRSAVDTLLFLAGNCNNFNILGR